jgi:hypothetical protein
MIMALLGIVTLLYPPVELRLVRVRVVHVVAMVKSDTELIAVGLATRHLMAQLAAIMVFLETQQSGQVKLVSV